MSVSHLNKSQLLALTVIEPTAANLLAYHRFLLLEATDWWAVGDRTMSTKEKNYRKALRDLPANNTPTLDEFGGLDVASVDWPVPLASQTPPDDD